MSLMNELKKQMLDAFKCKRIAEKDILRLVIGKAQTLEANLNTTLGDYHIEAIIRKEIKNNNESLTTLKEGSEAYIRVIEESIALNKFLPATLTQDEIEVRLVDLTSKICDAKNDGQAMGMAMNLFKSTDQKVDSDDVKTVVLKIRNSNNK